MIGSVGTFANGFVLLALLCTRQSRRKNINVFIINQTFLDLLSCLFLIFTIVVNDIKTASIAVKWITCLLFKTKTIVAVVSYSSIFGLVVITVERYVKVVHPVAHRNHYRRWMTYAGVILPWIDGVCCYLIPAWATASMVDGKCLGFQWSTQEMYNAYVLTMFVLHHVLPPAFFFFAYYRIIGVIRRQQSIVAPNVDATSPALAGGSSHTASRAAHGHMKHKREMNVVRTMTIIVLCFCICYLPYNVYLPLFPGVSLSYLLQPLQHFTFFTVSLLSCHSICL